MIFERTERGGLSILFDQESGQTLTLDRADVSRMLATLFPDCSCIAKVIPGEPTFLLRAKDLIAPTVVETWAHEAAAVGAPAVKVEGARAIALRMRAWDGPKHFPD